MSLDLSSKVLKGKAMANKAGKQLPGVYRSSPPSSHSRVESTHGEHSCKANPNCSKT